MPHVNLYVRTEDYEDYLSISDKPDWLHRSIQAEVVAPAALQPAQVNRKSHGPTVTVEPLAIPNIDAEQYYEPFDDLP